MSTVGAHVERDRMSELMALGIDVIRQETAQAARRLWSEFGSGQLDGPAPPPESSIERGFRARGRVDDEWGRSESLDPDNVGDIADEGAGHRG